MSLRHASLAAAALLAVLLPGAALPEPGEARDPETALVEGNRRFRRNDFEGAMQVYASGYGSGASPILAYNLGVTAQRLDRLPEAILWYRKAQLSLGADPWLQDNLELARSALGAPERERPPGARWAAARVPLLFASILLAWSVLPLALRSSRRRWPLALAAALSLSSFTAGTLLGHLGPRAAVLLADCPSVGAASGSLPAGTEVWVSGDDGQGGWRVLGEPEGPVCPSDAVCLVEAPGCR